MSNPDLAIDAHLQRVVLPLIAVAQDAAWHPVGTAFVVGTFTSSTALLLTATHNLKHLVSMNSPPSGRAPSMPSDFLPPPPKSVKIKNTHFYAGVEGPNGFVLAEVVKSWHQNEGDIAVLIAVLPPESPSQFTGGLAIDPSPVPTGRELTAIGYAGMSARFLVPPDYDLQDFQVEFAKGIAIRTGVVTAAHPQGVGIYNWPGFTVACGFDSGMSGGPLLDMTREVPIVRGVVCGDMSEDRHNGGVGSGAHAFASTLWPALGTEMDVNVHLASGEKVRVKRFIDLLAHKMVNDRGDSGAHFQCIPTDTGYTVGWT